MLAFSATGALAQERPGADQVLHNWSRMVLELVRHTPTYSPPVASRAFAYLGVTAYEAAAGAGTLVSLAGQLNGLSPAPEREAGAAYDEAVVMQAAMAFGVRNFFGNTGPTGQRAMKAMEARLAEMTAAGLAQDVIARSVAYGEAVGAHVLAWSMEDGGAVVENMGFPFDHALNDKPGAWAPTSLVVQQQAPLLPKWGENRSFAMPTGASCPLPPPPAYSEEAGSEFHAEALAVYETSKALTPEQTAIARFWSDDPMLSPTPPGHWIFIAMDILQAKNADVAERADLLARLGVALADSFIGCWHAKYEYDLIRPVTYIRRVIDPNWQPILITPPFPEYPSGHSTQSGAAAAVLTAHFGAEFAFDDATHEDEGLGVRAYPDFWTAAEEAAMSRLYGGIHFRAAIERGLEQGRCIGAFATALKTVE
ncbi:MAG: vanadium-dependent haloperoxidase [Rhizobiaceae bacterium]|nr:vanadium-dependent haloperoxidase [Rhizobiaceae bacterium]